MYSPSSCFGCWPEPTIESIRSSATRTTPTPSDSSVCRQTSGFFILKIQKVQETAVTGRARWVFRQPPKQIQPYDYALSKAGCRLVVVSNRLYLSATGVMFGNPSGLCPAPNFVPHSVTLRGRLAVTIQRCRWPSAIVPGFRCVHRQESERSPANYGTE